MTEKFPETGEPIAAQPLSDDQLERVSGGTADRSAESGGLLMQANMQNENQIFTSVADILKAKHDTAKNSIDNIR